MPSLPQPGETNWGNKLNEFLLTGHNIDGTLKGVQNVINVKDFGATGNQNDNVAVAFQAAVDSVPDGGGAIILIPPGVHRLETSIIVRDKFIIWQGSGGSGFGVCEVRCANNNKLGFLDVDISDALPTSNPNPAFGVRNLLIRTHEMATIASPPLSIAIKYKGEHAILTGTQFSGIIENVSIEGVFNASSAFKIGIDIDNASSFVIRDCTIVGANVSIATGEYKLMEHGVRVGNFSTHVHCENVHVQLAEVAFGMVGTNTSEDMKIIRCTATQCDYGLKTDTAVGGVQNVTYTHFSTFLGGIKMANSHAYFNGNLFFKREDSLASHNYIGMDFSGRGIICVGNQFLNQSSAGGQATAIRITDNTALTNTDVSIIAHNVIIPGIGGGWNKTIELGGGVIRCIVRDNMTYIGAPQIINNGTENEIKEWTAKPVPTVASTNALTLTVGHDLVKVSGTSNITSISATYAGHVVTLIFTGNASGIGLTAGSNLKIAGNFGYGSNDTITLVCDGTNWFERSRSLN